MHALSLVRPFTPMTSSTAIKQEEDNVREQAAHSDQMKGEALRVRSETSAY